MNYTEPLLRKVEMRKEEEQHQQQHPHLQGIVREQRLLLKRENSLTDTFTLFTLG